MRFILLLILLVFAWPLQASQLITLDLEKANLVATLKWVAQFLNQNIIVSDDIQQTITLHLKQLPAEQVFALLLSSQNLFKHMIGKTWVITTPVSVIKQAEQHKKYQQLHLMLEQPKTIMMHLQYAKALEVAKLLHQAHRGLLSARGIAQPDARTNLLLLQDVSPYWHRALLFIKALDKPVAQIRIQVRLLSIDCEFEKALGIAFPDRVKISTVKQAVWLESQLALLEKTGHAVLISNPSLFTVNQQPASIESGDDIPYQASSESGGTTAVFKKAVLGLQVTPQVLPNHRVLLRMQINQDRPSSQLIQGVPTISTRQMITQVLAKDGETIVLGGIYEVDDSTNDQAIPGLQHIPIVSWLTHYTHQSRTKRELLIFVTPTILLEQ